MKLIIEKIRDKIYIINYIILISTLFSCVITSKTAESNNSTWMLTNLKQKIESNFILDNWGIIYVLAFENHNQRNFYHIFDKTDTLSSKVEVNDGVFQMKEYDVEYSKFIETVMRNIPKNDYSLLLEKSSQCDDCYSVTIYEFLAKRKKVTLSSDNLVSNFYLGPLE